MRRKEHRDTIKKEEEFEQRVVDVARVTRVMAGGKRMKFRVCLAIGDKKGRVGMSLAKGADVTIAISKALLKAKKNVIKVPIVNDTIIHSVEVKYKAARILLKPAQKGTGIKAGGPVRILCELAGIPNITGKILGSKNKINIVRATLLAFSSFKIVKNPNQEKEERKAKEILPKAESSKENKDEDKKTLKDKIKNFLKKE